MLVFPLNVMLHLRFVLPTIYSNCIPWALEVRRFASIAAVAQVQLKTRQKHEDLGTVIHVAGSKYISQEPCTCAVGPIFL